MVVGLWIVSKMELEGLAFVFLGGVRKNKSEVWI